MRYARKTGATMMVVAGISFLSGCSVLGGHSGSDIGNAPRPSFAQSTGGASSTADSGASQANNADESNPYASAGAPDTAVYETKPSVVLTPQSARQCRHLSLHPGETISVRLPANKESGLAWQLDHRPDGLALLTAPKAVTRQHEDASRIAGATTTVVYDWRFKADTRTQGTLRLLYHDPDDQQHASKATFQCSVRVR